MPVGTWMGGLLGWRLTFGFLAIHSVLLFAWILFAVPNYPGQARNMKMPIRKVLTTPGVRPVLSVAVLWMLAHNVLYTFVSPFISRSGMGNQVDVLLLTFGLAAIVGILLVGKLVDVHLRSSVLCSLVAFGASAVTLGLAGQSKIAVYLGVVVWGATFGGAATLLHTALADAAGDGADVALSMSVVAWNLAIAMGGVAGGLILSSAGVGMVPWVMLLLMVLALWISIRARRHGFVASRTAGRLLPPSRHMA